MRQDVLPLQLRDETLTTVAVFNPLKLHFWLYISSPQLYVEFYGIAGYFVSLAPDKIEDDSDSEKYQSARKLLTPQTMWPIYSCNLADDSDYTIHGR